MTKGVITIEVKDPFGNLIGRTDVTDDGWVKIGVVLDGTAGVDRKGTEGIDLKGAAGVSKDQPF